MALTRDFRDTVAERAARDPEFAGALLAGAARELLAGDVDTARALLRDYVNATVGFAAVAEDIGSHPKSVMRMLGPGGNPRADNLVGLLASLQRRTGVTLDVTAETTA